MGAPSGPHCITNILKPAGEAYSVSPSIGSPNCQGISFSALIRTCSRSAHTLVGKNSSLVLVRAVFSALGTGTYSFTIRSIFRRVKVALPMVVSNAVASTSNHALSKRAARTFCGTVHRIGPVSFKLGYTLKPSRLHRCMDRLSHVSRYDISTRPGTNLPGTFNRCSLSPRRVTRRIGR